MLCVPKTSSTSSDQAIFADRATGASLSSDAVQLKIDRFGQRFPPRPLRGSRRSRPSAPDGPRCCHARGAGPRRLPACAHLLVRVRSRHVRVPRAARAPEDTLTMYPDWHGQASTSTPLAGTGHAWRLPPALLRSFLPSRGSTSGSLLAGAVAGARPRPGSALNSAPNSSAVGDPHPHEVDDHCDCICGGKNHHLRRLEFRAGSGAETDS
jgi:hypothetical protein